MSGQKRTLDAGALMSARIAELTAQRDALLAACKALINAPHQEHFAARLNEQEMAGIEAIKAAIAQAEPNGGKEQP